VRQRMPRPISSELRPLLSWSNGSRRLSRRAILDRLLGHGGQRVGMVLGFRQSRRAATGAERWRPRVFVGSIKTNQRTCGDRGVPITAYWIPRSM